MVRCTTTEPTEPFMHPTGCAAWTDDGDVFGGGDSASEASADETDSGGGAADLVLELNALNQTEERPATDVTTGLARALVRAVAAHPSAGAPPGTPASDDAAATAVLGGWAAALIGRFSVATSTAADGAALVDGLANNVAVGEGVTYAGVAGERTRRQGG